MLRTRILTAVVLLALLLPTLVVSDPLPFSALAVVFCAIGMAEWAALAGVRSVAMRWVLAFLWAAAVAWCLTMLRAQGWQLPAQAAWVWWVVGLIWLALLLGSLPRASLPTALRTGPVGVVLGAAILAGAWLALVLFRAQGTADLLSLLALVWVADVSAYFGGRAWGRRKLAPAISPGKTWAGVWTALVAVLAYALGWLLAGAGLSNVFSQLLARWGWTGLFLCVVLLLVFAISGDLFESLLKRAAGVKDSGRILPGHGGVLDRIDALLPVLPLAMLMLTR